MWDIAALLLLIVLAVGLRAMLVQTSDFPLGDGGFFYQSVLDLQANNFIPPQDITYNQIDVPNAYPPGALYIVGGLERVLSVPLLELFRWYPVVMSAAALLFVYMFARDYFESRQLALLATALVAFMPLAVLDTTSGGGVVRATGLFFASVALQQGYRLIRTRRHLYIPPTILALVLTLLTQPQWGVFAVASLLILLTSKESTLESVLWLLTALILVSLLGLGWIYYVSEILDESLRPFRNAALNQFDETPLLLLMFTSPRNLTGEPLIGLMAGLSMVGLFVCIASGRVELLFWALLVTTLPFLRANTIVLPVALVTAVAIDRLVLTGVGSFRVPGRYDSRTGRRLTRGNNWAVVVAYGGTMLLLLLTAVGTVRAHEQNRFRIHTPQERAAMTWIANRTEPDSVFLVVTGASEWRDDAVSDWFPVLAQRMSYATVRAFAWSQEITLEDSFVEREARYIQLQNCVEQQAVCLDQIIPANQPDVYVYLAAGVYGSLRPSLLASDRYERVYPIGSDTSDVLIFRRTG